jgi:hypothetical protein
MFKILPSIVLGKENGYVEHIRRPRQSNIQLTVSENFMLQIDTDMVQRLALAFVNRHGESQFDRELGSREGEGKVGRGGKSASVK